MNKFKLDNIVARNSYKNDREYKVIGRVRGLFHEYFYMDIIISNCNASSFVRYDYNSYDRINNIKCPEYIKEIIR